MKDEPFRLPNGDPMYLHANCDLLAIGRRGRALIRGLLDTIDAYEDSRGAGAVPSGPQAIAEGDGHLGVSVGPSLEVSDVPCSSVPQESAAKG